MYFTEGLLIGSLLTAVVMIAIMLASAHFRRKRKLAEEKLLLKNQLEAWVRYAVKKGYDPAEIRAYYNHQVKFISIITNPKKGDRTSHVRKTPG